MTKRKNRQKEAAQEAEKQKRKFSRPSPRIAGGRAEKGLERTDRPSGAQPRLQTEQRRFSKELSSAREKSTRIDSAGENTLQNHSCEAGKEGRRLLLHDVQGSLRKIKIALGTAG